MGDRYLICGRPKSGKTGALAALANAGWTLRILDFDGNAPLILRYCKSAEAKKRVQIVTCVDEMRIVPEAAASNTRTLLKADGAPKGYEGALRALEKWPTDKTRCDKWGEKDVLVVDTLTYMARSILARRKHLNNSEDKKTSWDDYEGVQSEIDRFMVLCKALLSCPMLALTHLQMIGPDLNVDAEDDSLKDDLLREKLKGAENVPWALKPTTLGRAQAERLAGHFTGVLYFKAVEGQEKNRKIYTAPVDGFDAGVPIPGLPRELSIEDGLATILTKARDLSK